MPFLVLFQVGFLYTGLLSIVQQYAGSSEVVATAAAARPPGLMKSKVAVLKVTPETILSDIDRLVRARRHVRRARARQDDDPQGQHLLALPVPGREHDAVAARGDDPGAARGAASPTSVCVQNKTVVTNAFKGEDLNHYVPIFKQLRDPRPLQLQGRGHEVGASTARRRRCTCSITSSPTASTIPDYFFGKNIVHLPTVKCHIYTTTTGAMKNAFGGLLERRTGTTRTRGSTRRSSICWRSRRRSTPASSRSWTARPRGNGPGPRTMFPVVKDYMLASRRSGRHRRRRREDDGLRSDVARVHPARARRRPRRRRSARHRDRRRRRCAKESWGFSRRRQRRERRSAT